MNTDDFKQRHSHLLDQLSSDSMNILWTGEMTLEEHCDYMWFAFIYHDCHFKSIIMNIRTYGDNWDVIEIHEFIDIDVDHNIRIFNQSNDISKNHRYARSENNHFEYSMEHKTNRDEHVLIMKTKQDNNKYFISMDINWNNYHYNFYGTMYPELGPLYLRECLKLYLKNPSFSQCHDLFFAKSLDDYYEIHGVYPF